MTNRANVGDATATSVLGQLYSAYPGMLKVYDGAASYPDMAVGAQGASASPHYDVTLEPSAGCAQEIGATMTITGAGFSVGSAFKTDIGVYQKSYPSTDTPIGIPRSSSTGISSYINVPVTFPLTDGRCDGQHRLLEHRGPGRHLTVPAPPSRRSISTTTPVREFRGFTRLTTN